MEEDERFLEAIKLNILGITFMSFSGGILTGVLLTGFFNGVTLAVGIGIILATSGFVVYTVGVSKR